METAIILAEGEFGNLPAKTANGLVRYSKKYKIMGIIDSTKVGQDASEVLDGVKRNISIFRDIHEALNELSEKPDWLIVGVATVGGFLPKNFRPFIIDALSTGVGIVSGLHEFLAEDKEFVKTAKKTCVKIVDIRKEKPINQMHRFSNLAKDIHCLRIAVLGTDGSIGKRTTALILAEALNETEIKTEFIATGQTGLLQGARYGLPLDAIQGDYMVGELEHTIFTAYTEQRPQVIIVEGQGALSHPAYVCCSRAIISALKPHTVILQHAPGRKERRYRRDELHLPMLDVSTEINLLRAHSNANLLAITLNHENMTAEEILAKQQEYEKKYHIPCIDVLKDGCEPIIDVVKDYLER